VGGAAGQGPDFECDPTFVVDEVDRPSQAELNALAGVSAVRDFVFFEFPVVNDLTPLRCLKSIGGSLTLADMLLYSLNGLENLESIGGVLYIEAIFIEDMDPLRNLRSVHSMEIIFNADLASLGGLENVVAVPGSITIDGNESLPACAPEQLIAAIGEANIGSFTIGNNGPDCMP
jgi:hypothetical protein